MTRWIRRNGRALLIVVLMVDLIGITVTRPAWHENIGYRRPSITVPYGQAANIGGVSWQLSPITLPDPHELSKYSYGASDLDIHPPNGRIAAFLWHRTRDGKPAGVPTGYSGCESTAVSGGREWTKQAVAVSLNAWVEHLGYTTTCLAKRTGPLLTAIVVPTDVQLTSIDVDFIPESWEDKSRISKASELLVVRFDTR